MNMVLAAWEEFMGHVPDEYKAMIGGPPIFRNDKAVMPLQAADLHAGWCRHVEGAALLAKEIPTPRWGEKGDDLQRITWLLTGDLAASIYEDLYGVKPVRVTYRMRWPYWPDEASVSTVVKMPELVALLVGRGEESDA